MTILLWALFIASGFVSGSIMYSRLIPKLVLHKDVCERGDGNPGAYNVFAYCGKGMGILCLLLDVLKGFVPVFIACFILDYANIAFGLVIAAPVLGHAVGAFNGFHGGKCISTSFGVMFGIAPVTFLGITLLAALYILFAAIVRIKSNRICSIIVYSLFLLFSAVIFTATARFSVALGCALVSAAAIIKHVKAVAVEEEAESEKRDC